MSLALYRSLLQSSKQFKDYNLRAYCLRRCRLAFEQARNETDPAAVQALQEAERKKKKGRFGRFVAAAMGALMDGLHVT